MSNRFKFELMQWDVGRVSHVYQFISAGLHGADWGIKGHNHPWILTNGDWQPGMKVLDVGAGYSDLAAHLADQYDLEAWVADSFGMNDGDPLWSRWGAPDKLMEQNPQVNYVFKDLGSPVPELEPGSFDRVFSVSVLEHIHPQLIGDVLLHMASLLKPGGLMLHAVDFPFPRTVTQPGVGKSLAVFGRILLRHALIALGAPGHKPYMHTIEGWSKLLRSTFDIQGTFKGLSTSQIILDHDVLVEPPEIVYKFYPPNDKPKPYWRSASLLFILRLLDPEAEH